MPDDGINAAPYSEISGARLQAILTLRPLSIDEQGTRRNPGDVILTVWRVSLADHSNTSHCCRSHQHHSSSHPSLVRLVVRTGDCCRCLLVAAPLYSASRGLTAQECEATLFRGQVANRFVGATPHLSSKSLLRTPTMTIKPQGDMASQQEEDDERTSDTYLSALPHTANDIISLDKDRIDATR